MDGSFLAFAGGRLTARDVQSTRLRAGVAVLGACQTGLGKSLDAGTIGLARAFSLAGVPALVMSLWDVDDAATNLLMGRFYELLGEAPPHEALRRAMLETRRVYPAPRQWASFQLLGVPMRMALKPDAGARRAP